MSARDDEIEAEARDWKKRRVEEARKDMTVSAARAQVAALCKDACITPREVAALEMLLEASDPARRPRLLAPGEEIPPGCTAEMRAAIVSGTVALVDEARGRTYHLPAAVSRAFSPHGRTSAEIEAAAGVAARELCAEHEPGAGAVVEVRLVRRAEQAPRKTGPVNLLDGLTDPQRRALTRLHEALTLDRQVPYEVRACLRWYAGDVDATTNDVAMALRVLADAADRAGGAP